MKKKDFLETPAVRSFINYMSQVINGTERIDFPYSFLPQKAPKDFSKRFKSLSGIAQTMQEMFDRYWWNKEYFPANAVRLDEIRTKLRTTLAQDSPSNDAVLQAVSETMYWGLGKGAASIKNIQWAIEQGDQLHLRLLTGKATMESDSPQIDAFNEVRMNAGYTKVYSLLSDAVVIYDGRVGAALGWLVRRFLAVHPEWLTELNIIPEELQFRWAPQKGDSPPYSVNRDPSGDGLKFKKLEPQNSVVWARLNIYANWILEAARIQSSADWCCGNDSLRRIEAALFMIGYRLPTQTASSSPFDS